MSNFESDRDQLIIALKPARRHLHWANVVAALAKSSTIAAYVLMSCAVATAVVLITSRLSGSTSDNLWQIALATTAITVLACLAIPAIRVAVRRPSLAATAQRLDLGLHDHNAIATALQLATDDGRPSPMAGIAIRDGLSALRAGDPSRLVAEPPSWKPRRLAMMLMTSGVLYLAPFLTWRAMGDPVIEGPLSQRAQFATIGPLHDEDRLSRRTIQQSELSAGTQQQAQDGMVSAAASPTAATRSSDSADTRPSTSKSAGAITIGKAAAKVSSGTSVNDTLRAANADDDATSASVDDKSKPAESSNSSSVASGPSASSNGSSGGKSGADAVTSAASNDKSSPTATPPTDENGTDTTTSADPEAPSAYSPGTSPLRQDRGGPVSRELGQSGTTGESGNGRGGPSEAKKARGAGAVFLSVPLPDYLAGKLSPGTNRVTRQQAPPQPTPLPTPPDVPVARNGTTEESVIDQYNVPLADGPSVARYLKALHRDEPTVSATDPESLSTPTGE